MVVRGVADSDPGVTNTLPAVVARWSVLPGAKIFMRPKG
jgi:hypothetical protein